MPWQLQSVEQQVNATCPPAASAATAPSWQGHSPTAHPAVVRRRETLPVVTRGAATRVGRMKRESGRRHWTK